VRDDHILLRTDTEVANHLQSHLQKYLMFSKTRMTVSKLSVWACREATDSDSNSVSESKVTVIRNGGFSEVWCHEDARPHEVIDANIYRANRLTHGEARLLSTTIGKYLPQDLNFDINGLIDFDKGCYTGQEIIARLHYRGQPKRRLCLLTLAAQSDVVAGDKVLNVEGKSMGTVVECLIQGDECLCLCETVIDIDSHEASIQDHPATPSTLQRF
jgi:folate-binding protein YgfZ